jgi:hypothetical protein
MDDLDGDSVLVLLFLSCASPLLPPSVKIVPEVPVFEDPKNPVDGILLFVVVVVVVLGVEMVEDPNPVIVLPDPNPVDVVPAPAPNPVEVDELPKIDGVEADVVPAPNPNPDVDVDVAVEDDWKLKELVCGCEPKMDLVVVEPNPENPEDVVELPKIDLVDDGAEVCEISEDPAAEGCGCSVRDFLDGLSSLSF